MRKTYNNIIAIDSIYSLLLFLIYSGDSKHNLYIISTRIGKSIYKNLKGDIIILNHNYSINTYFERNKIIKALRAIHLKLYVRYKIAPLSSFNYEKLYANDLNFFAKIIIKKNKYILIEDGYGNYEEAMYYETTKQRFKRFLFGSIIPWGQAENCEKIILTGLGEIIDIIKDKVEIIDTKKAFGMNNKRKAILRVFNLEKNLINKLIEKPIILLTQPFSELKILTEGEKIEVYKKCLKNINISEVIIKTHPDETTDYTKHFKGATVVNQIFPFEVLGLMDIRFKKTITLFSTAALGFKDTSEIVWYGSEVHPKLFEKYGHQPML